MNSAERFENNLSSVFNKFFRVVSQEKVILQNFLALFQIYLRFLEVKFDIQAEDKFGDRIFVGIFLLLDDLDEIALDCLSLSRVNRQNNSCSQVTEKPWSHSLDSMRVVSVVKEELDEKLLSSAEAVEKDEE